MKIILRNLYFKIKIKEKKINNKYEWFWYLRKNKYKIKNIKFIDFTISHSSIKLQKLLFFDRIYSVLFFLIELVLYTFKGSLLPFPPKILATEIIGLVFYIILQMVKLRIQSMGNKTEIKIYLVYSTGFSLPVLGIYLFYFLFQIYPMIFDFISCIIGAVFCILEIIICLYLDCFFSLN